MQHIIPANLASTSGKGDYRAVLIVEDNLGSTLIQVQQLMSNGEWRGTPGRWYLETLEERKPNTISIDHGQGWAVTGMTEAIVNGRKLLNCL